MVVDAPYALPKSVLLDYVAKAFRVRMAIGRDLDSGGRRCTLVGFGADLDSTELLFTSLLLQASSAVAVAGRGRRDIKAFRRAFLIGYAHTIGSRLARAQADAEEEATQRSPGTDLVLADRTALVEQAFTEQFPHIRMMRTTISSGGGLNAGRQAGHEAQLTGMRSTLDSTRRSLHGALPH